MRSLTELNEGLNDYLKLYCEESKKTVESELVKAKADYSEKVEKLNQTIEKLRKQEEAHEKEEQAWI
jgi:predicted ribosome quality control (RQC) complex YloA/Tae2 family protein